jgi:hypothetical protein
MKQYFYAYQTEKTHGKIYLFASGPYKTRKAAIMAANY